MEKEIHKTAKMQMVTVFQTNYCFCRHKYYYYINNICIRQYNA